MIINVDHSKFINNTGYSVLRVINIDNVMITLHLNEFINNNIPTGVAVVHILYYTTAENLTVNVFINNNATYKILIGSVCGSNLSLNFFGQFSLYSML